MRAKRRPAKRETGNTVESSVPSSSSFLARTHTQHNTNRNHDNQRANKSDTELLNLMESMIQLYLIIISSFSRQNVGRHWERIFCNISRLIITYLLKNEP